MDICTTGGFTKRQINVEPYQHWRKLSLICTFRHILIVEDRNHSHYHCVVDYLLFPSLAKYRVSCRPPERRMRYTSS
ncbi:hypothetical protein DMO59_08200 [Salmonella enterica subsp. diarizonae]|uniref:Uncharacterized protein n=1 Tax=Salmonella enterica subsp. salamae serovar 47:b:1,5 TaxID=1967619 RepID=A0A701UDH2_SALER|nr:hypothetical protein [Salmonella enterica]ECE1086390.1 hypothetical protein [Salmonella enterica subsp. diarizonae]ECJ4481056.1 hypothetical protein [Salmonella enterica subsp. diarizonae]ECJ4763402.1 hypothetical protein [Salmonella enterica subsp. diarizonae]HAC6515723.1 hypothetical protein [Salmonella enterica subsp. salamae serovar 47:b:1,5]